VRGQEELVDCDNLAKVLLIISFNNDSLTIPSALLQIGGLFFCKYLQLVDMERARMAEPSNSCWWIIISHHMITSANFSLASADDGQLSLFLGIIRILFLAGIGRRR
jgi:hypothetical protein